MLKNTPGPWFYNPVIQTGLTRPYEKFDIFHKTPDCYDNGYGVNTGANIVYIGVIRRQASKVTTEANARLIAAAPVYRKDGG